MKNRECWKDLNAQSSQKVIEELVDRSLLLQDAGARRHSSNILSTSQSILG